MRPIRLQMIGFGAFRDGTEVDFADLELVALVGGTGSGKSTIIDAITFALFGRIARLDAGSVEPVINALSAEARVLFEFDVAGASYPAARVVRRTKTGATTKEARLESDGEVLAEGPKELAAGVEELLGLNFDRFNRVVVLPQGKFAAFLHDRPSSRQDLMRRLLDLGIYERLGTRARSISRQAATQLDVLRPKLEAGGVSDEAFAALKGERDAVTATKLALDIALATRRTSIAARDEAAKTAHDFGVLVLAVANVDVPTEVAELGDEIAGAVAAQEVAAKGLVHAEAAAETSAQACKDGPDLGECRRLLDVHAGLFTSVGAAEKLAVTLEAAAGARDESAARVAELDVQVTEADNRVVGAEAAEKLAIEAAASGPSRADLDKAKAIVQAVVRIEAEVEPAETAAAASNKEVETAASSLQSAEEQLGNATGEVRRIENENHAHVLVGSLVEGEACPVCQQTIGEIPDLESAGELASAMAAEAKVEQLVAEVRTATIQAEKRQAASESRLADVSTRLETARQAAGVVPPASEIDGKSAQIDKLEVTAAAAKAEREQASIHARTLRDSDDVRTAQTEATSAASVHTRTEAELAAAQRRTEELEKQLDGKPAETEVTVMVERADQLAIVHNETIATEKLAEQESKTSTQAVVALQESERSLRQEFTSTWAGFKAIDAPTPQGSSLLDDWRAFANWSTTQQAPLETQYTKAAQVADAASAKVTEDELTIRTLTGELEDADGCEIDDLSPFMLKLLAQAEAAVNSAQQRRKELEADVAQVEQLEEAQQVHDMLGNRLLKSSGFEQWMMEEVVQALVERASERLFELSGGQYSIESDDMDFEVRDHRNGDELRDARTLSGGETFLASLALALALADSLHAMAPEGTPPLESLFLDEGFGTLDPETLDVVAAAIEELGASGRMVGIITHIRELAERMPVRFEVTKEATSSVVVRVEA